MKYKKIITLSIIVLLIVAIAIAGIGLAESGLIGQGIEEKDRTSILLVPQAEEADADGKYKVDVYLEMDDGMLVNEGDSSNPNVVIKDAASVASFQIGLDIYATIEDDDIESKIHFDYNEDLQEGKEGVQLAKHTETPITKQEKSSESVEKTIGERLNLYYVGTKELNEVDPQKPNAAEPLKVGTITFNSKEFENNSTVLITPEEENEEEGIGSVAASIGHTKTPIVVDKEEDHIELILNKSELDITPDDDEENQGGGNQGDNEGDNNQGGGSQGEGSQSGNTGNTGNNQGDNSNQGGSSQGSGSQNNGSQNNNGSTNSKNNVKPSKVKTGANRSAMRILIPLAILIVIAFAIVFIKARMRGKNSKH